MKKLIIMMALCGLFTLLVVDKSIAQIKLPEVTITSPDQLPVKVSNAFQSTFPDAKEPRWYHPNKNYVVTFLMNDIKHNALFSKNGYLIYQISYGNESTLPEDMKPQVEERFAGYDIIAAINVKQNGRNIWFITGEGKKDFLNVNFEGGVMSEGTKVKRYDAKSSIAKGRDD
ncbi:hypothetical protein GZH53_05005 [Flavihumibacter sp. R14]|nr:hypothetical protein [Flavihumibacter soli]